MLERWQVKKIQDKVGPMLNYLPAENSSGEDGKAKRPTLQIRVGCLQRCARFVRGLALFVLSGWCVPRAGGVTCRTGQKE
jgi:hypothetical protein